ncbi:Aste57867_20267 [Aphanomyces stellatus]|uniref:Aste57867_20267 protein n=1 Tax=Aphanomyces stellatus TaxID=120398 RepID=A0A485LEQ7_9STRA|nr:hypothetical protein As57867_020201 [Aphanomyces stellatus]VFT96957.1 Aste57867_20267 [Aphanomyces stellatus]
MSLRDPKAAPPSELHTYRSEDEGEEEKPMMQACYYTKYGKPSVLQIGSLPRAKLLAPDDILVRVHAASISPIDYKRREGAYKLVFDAKWPTIVGYDMAGVVVLCGADVKKFNVGDEVFACVPHDRDGTLAEYASVPERAAAFKPKNLSFVQAAAVPISSLVAMQTIRRLKLKAGQNVLITGGSGGVGTFALQMARNIFNAGTIVTTAAQQKEHILTRLGATTVVDYTEKQFEKVVDDMDCAMDCTSEAKKCLDCVKSGGVVATIADTPPPEAMDEIQDELHTSSCCLGIVLGCLSYSMKAKARSKRVAYTYVLVSPDGKMLSEIAAYCEDGAIRPVIDKVFPFAQALDAIELLEAGHVTGKIVVEMATNAAQPESE